ncbi:methionyl-tRNA formyltransferase-like protein [Chaetomium sp. MPI-CAGE-AT-0009]|nr:methionyl-tRNA formyltransferase-like protein [Chaetomium sp. MPI-CAGE-AT-0009]
MLLPRLAQSSLRPLWSTLRPRLWQQSYSTAPKKSDPLRILFCGSDEFSCASLKALHHEHKHNADLIRSIDVVVRPSKPTGRGYKVIREVPLRGLAEKLSLPIHVRDTFTGWDMPKPDGDPINLIVAVSFGLFVPPRLIHASKYGGVNVHPSLLPDLRGPAPIHHALLAGRLHTGITIQTLSPEAFDEGVPLLQTPQPGIPIPPNCTPAQLHDLLAPAGAEMLVRALRAGLHVPPHEPYQQQPPTAPAPTTTANPTQHQPQPQFHPQPKLQHAPKITPQDRQILWTVHGADEVVRRAQVLGSLWTHLGRSDGGSGGGGEKRAILEGVSVVGGPPPGTSVSGSASVSGGSGGSGAGSGSINWDGDGVVVWVQKTPLPRTKEARKAGEALKWETESITSKYWVDGDREAVIVRMGGSWLRIGMIKVEGSTFKPARVVLEGWSSKGGARGE